MRFTFVTRDAQTWFLRPGSAAPSGSVALAGLSAEVFLELAFLPLKLVGVGRLSRLRVMLGHSAE